MGRIGAKGTGSNTGDSRDVSGCREGVGRRLRRWSTTDNFQRFSWIDELVHQAKQESLAASLLRGTYGIGSEETGSHGTRSRSKFSIENQSGLYSMTVWAESKRRLASSPRGTRPEPDAWTIIRRADELNAGGFENPPKLSKRHRSALRYSVGLLQPLDCFSVHRGNTSCVLGRPSEQGSCCPYLCASDQPA